MTGRRLLSVSRDCLNRVTLLAAAYRMTGDLKYFTQAEAELLAAAAFSDWNPSHFLDVGEMTAALGIGYDRFYVELSDDSKSRIRTAIVEKGLNPSFGPNNWWVNTEHNWNQVCHGGLTLGALAIRNDEPELAARIIHRAVNSITVAMDEYAPDGAYPEGPGYWSYGTMYNVALIAPSNRHSVRISDSQTIRALPTPAITTSTLPLRPASILITPTAVAAAASTQPSSGLPIAIKGPTCCINSSRAFGLMAQQRLLLDPTGVSDASGLGTNHNPTPRTAQLAGTRPNSCRRLSQLMDRPRCRLSGRQRRNRLLQSRPYGRRLFHLRSRRRSLGLRLRLAGLHPNGIAWLERL
jgi:hypothetical protein